MTAAQKKLLLAVYGATLFYSFHYAIPLYTESSFLNFFFSKSITSFIYVFAALATLIACLNLTKHLRRFGIYKIAFTTTLGEILSLCGLAFFTSPLALFISFILHHVFVSIIFVTLTMFIEELTRKEDMGAIHGVFLTVLNLGILLAPLISGFVYQAYGFKGIFFVSACVLLPTLFLIGTQLKKVHDPTYTTPNMIDAFFALRKNKDVAYITSMQFLLDFFFTIMVIYIPLYLPQYFHISLPTLLGVIMPIALLPFVIFPYELGKLADTTLGEQEILIFGFSILAVTSFLVGIMQTESILLWAILLFMSRVGASFVEAMTSAYFLKKVDREDSSTITLFSNTKSFAMIVAPLLALLTISLMSLPYVFIMLSLCMLYGVFIATKIHDTL